MRENAYKASAVHPVEIGGPAFVVAVIVVTGAFFLSDHNPLSLLLSSDADGLSEHAEEIGEEMTTGSPRRQVAYLALAAMGIFWLIRKRDRHLQAVDPLALLILLYLGWCAVSLLWSTEPMLTMKRVGVLMLAFAGALGLSRQLTGRQLTLLALCAATIYVSVGLAAEFVFGTFQPWQSGYRFAGTVHPNHQAPLCACLSLAAICLASHSNRYKSLLYALALAGIVLLLLTKSRASAGAFLAALVALWAVTVSRYSKVLTVSVTAWAISTVLVGGLLVGWEQQYVNVATLGRPEAVNSFTGRTPLWTELLNHVQSRPLLGYGYEAFWSPDRIMDVALAIGFPARSAHSAYFEALLSLGVVGSALFSLAVLMACWRTWASYRNSRDPGSAFVLAFLAFGIVDGLFESAFVQPAFVPFIVACGLMQLAFWHNPDTSAASGVQGREASRDGNSPLPEESNR